MIRILLTAIALLPLLIAAQDISTTRFMNDIRYLSSDELGGRWPGSKGDSLTLAYIKNEFIKAGVLPMGDDYYQYLKVTIGSKTGPGNRFRYNNDSLIVGDDFIPVSFTNDTTVCTTAVFAGYGIDSKTYNDFKKIDVKGKWAVILYDIPDAIIATVKDPLSVRARARYASEKGAAGVIFVYSGNNHFPSGFQEKSSGKFKIPVIAAHEKSLARFLTAADAGKMKSFPEKSKMFAFAGTYNFCITADIDPIEVTTANVNGYIPGTDPVLKNEYIVIGGHHDHLGMGGPGANSRKPDQTGVHHGADDNASGTAGVMELARLYANNPPKRSIVFSAFAAEEQGLLGSKYFVKNPPVPLKDISVMVNFDMIGRMKADQKQLSISGTGSSAEGDSILKRYEDTTLFRLRLRPGAGGGSDHASFYREKVPVFFFITGMHDDYHTPADTWEKIDSLSMGHVLGFAVKVVDDVANRPQKLTRKEAAEAQSENRHGGGRSIGIIPDISDASGKGLTVEGVRKGGPAEKAGMLKGDRIVAFDGKSVTGIQDYMMHLGTAKDGSRVTVEVVRMENGTEKKVKLKIQL